MIDERSIAKEGIGDGAKAVATQGFLQGEAIPAIHMLGIESFAIIGLPDIKLYISGAGIVSAEQIGLPIIGEEVVPIPVQEPRGYPIGILLPYSAATAIQAITVLAKGISSKQKIGKPALALDIVSQAHENIGEFGNANILLNLSVNGQSATSKVGKPMILLGRNEAYREKYQKDEMISLLLAA